MDQVKKLLEQYVQWIALALGVAFLLWMVYSYVYQPPVTVAVGPAPAVTPGEIDSQIWDGPGKKLRAELDSTAVVKVAVPPFGQNLQGDFAAPTPDALAMSGTWNTDVMPAAVNDATAPQPDQGNDPGNPKVTRLPVIPPMYNLTVSAGHSNVASVADASAAGAAATPPGSGNNPAAKTVDSTDRAWVTVGAMLPSSGLAAAFATAKIPTDGGIDQTTVLRVTLRREEKDASGNWGLLTEVLPPGIDSLTQLPPAVNDGPAAANAQHGYLLFAQGNAPLILRPAFYQVVEGDKWYVPGTPNPNVKALQLVDDKFDPAHPGDLSLLSDEERAAVQAYNRQQAQLVRQQRQPPRPPTRTPTPPRLPGRAPAVGFDVADTGRPLTASPLAQDTSGDPPLLMPPRLPTNPDATPPGAAPDGTPDATSAAPAALGELPKAPFEPAKQPDFMVWAHDDTVQPGKTYRYQLRYVIASPVYNTKQLCQPPSLADRFALASKDGDWSEPVNVESDTNFYATGLGLHGSVRFDVFKWQSGVWQVQQVDATPGDMIGTTDPKAGGASFATGWTLVDVREPSNNDANDRVILLASDNTTLQRQLRTDQRNATYRNLKKQVEAGKEKANGGINRGANGGFNGNRGGGPPPGFGGGFPGANGPPGTQDRSPALP